MNKDRIVNLMFAAVLIVGLGLLVTRTIMSGGPAPDPAMFSAGLSFHEAAARAQRESKPLLAVMSASWCNPCQSYRRGALIDPRVEQWVSANAVAVHVDVDEQSDVAGALGVASIPKTILLRDGKELGRFTGAESAEGLITWLTTTASKPAPGGS